MPTIVWNAKRVTFTAEFDGRSAGGTASRPSMVAFGSCLARNESRRGIEIP